MAGVLCKGEDDRVFFFFSDLYQSLNLRNWAIDSHPPRRIKVAIDAYMDRDNKSLFIKAGGRQVSRMESKGSEQVKCMSLEITEIAQSLA